MSFKSSTPVMNLKSCLLTRPPLALFSLCLASFILVTFSLAFYFQVDGNIKNPDILSLNDIGLNLNKINFCNSSVDDSSHVVTATASPALIQTSFVFEEESVGTWFADDTEYVAHIDAVDVGFESHSNITLSATLLGRQNSSVCVVFRHLPEVSFPATRGTNCSLKTTAKKIYLSKQLMSAKRGNVIHENCNESTSVSFRLKQKPDWDIMLNEEDKALINMHLMVMSYFLLATFFSILCFGIVRGGLKSNRQESPRHDEDSDREPLTT